MFLRFASATAVVSAALGVATTIALVVPAVPRDRLAPILFLWCLMPVVWGLWAMLCPRAWVPERLPLWGAILGLLPGSVAFFVLNLPERVVGVALPVGYRAFGLVLIALAYYFLWMLVRLSYRALAR